MGAEQVQASWATSGRKSAMRGFTAVEMLITLAIAGIFTTLALPSFVSTIRSNRLVTTTEMLQADLLVARRESIKRNTPVLVCPAAANPSAGADMCSSTYTSAAWSQGWLVCYQGGANMCDTNPPDLPNPIVRRGQLDGSLALTGPTALFFFKPNGTSNGAGIFKVKGSWQGSLEHRDCVQVTGVISLKPGTGDVLKDKCPGEL